MSKINTYDKWKEELKLQKVINASGKMTALGVSAISDDVAEAFKGGAQNFVNIEELYKKSGKKAAELVGADAGVVVNSASAGIAQGIAALIHKGRKKYIYSPIAAVTKDGIANEIIIPKGHNVNYGGPMDTLLEIAGAKIVEAGWSNRCNTSDLEIQITDKTVALMYVKSHHAVQKSIVSFLEMKKVADKHNIPMLIDIAAEEEIKKYLDAKIDLIVWSGSKAIAGPASGFVFGNEEMISWVADEHLGIGRSMKTDKGLIFSSLEALEAYMKEKPTYSTEILNFINDGINDKEFIKTTIVDDDSGRDLKRVKITLSKKSPITGYEFIEKMEAGSIGVYTRNHKANENIVFIDVRSINMNEAKEITQKVNAIFK